MKKITDNNDQFSPNFPEYGETNEINITEEELKALERQYQLLTSIAFPFQ